MSLLDRINSIHETLVTKQFAKKRDAFLKIENPNPAQIAEFEAAFKDTEEKQQHRTKTEALIVQHWKVYQSIINDPRYPKNDVNLLRSENRLRKGFADITIENDCVVKGKVNTGVLKDVTSDALDGKWKQYLLTLSDGTAAAPEAAAAAPAAAAAAPKKKKATPGKKRGPKAAAAAAPQSFESIADSFSKLIKDEHFIVVIGVNPEVAKAVDDLKITLEKGESIEEANRLWLFLQENVPASTACQGEDCNAKNAKLQDGLCAACLVQEVEARGEAIIDRFNVFKEEHDMQAAKRKMPQIEKEALKERFNTIMQMRHDYDDCHQVVIDSGGHKGYAAYKTIYDKLDAVLPKESLKKRRHFEANDEIIKSDESEASDSSDGSISHSGGDSEYQSDSSSSHSGGKKKRERSGGEDHFLGPVLDLFSPFHSEIERLSKVYKEDPSNFAKEFEETKKNRITRYKVVGTIAATGKDVPIAFDEPTIFITAEAAKKRGEEAIAPYDGTFSFRVIKI